MQLALVLLGGCAQGTGTKGYIDGGSTVREIKPADRVAVGTVSGKSLEGKPLNLTRTSVARAEGIAFVPESRRAMLFHHEPLYKNMSISILERISKLWLKPSKEREIARGHIEALRIRTPGADQLLGNLSGGNQQKVALAKWLTHAPKVLILSEPTRGMDVGAKSEVLSILRNLRNEGLSVLVVSSEPETVLAISDRVIVMSHGKMVAEMENKNLDNDVLMRLI